MRHGSDAVKVVCKAFFNAGTLPTFDYRDIREKGAELVTTGGQAPGPEPLRDCIEKLENILRRAVGRRLEPVEVHDMACVIADAVLAGGIRRAAMICLFDRDDEAMLTCKSNVCTVAEISSDLQKDQFGQVKYKGITVYGNTFVASASLEDVAVMLASSSVPWYAAYPARARANNSAVLPRGEVTEEEFAALMKRVEDSGCGEPGVYWTNNKDWGTNPCCEIALN